MSSSLTVSTPSPQPANPTFGTRRFAGRGSDEAGSGTPGFDALLADHAGPPPLSKEEARPDLSPHRPDVQRDESARPSDRGANDGPGVRRTPPHRVGQERDTAQTPHDVAPATDQTASPDPSTAVAAVTAVAADATAPPVAVAPTAPGPGLVPLPSTPDPSTTPSIAPVPGGQTAPDPGVVPGSATPAGHPALSTAPAAAGAEPAMARAMAPATTPGSVSTDQGASSASGDRAVVDGKAGHAAPTADAQGESVHPTTPGQPVDPPNAAASAQPHQGADGSRPDGPPTAGAGAVPVTFTPAPQATVPTASSHPVTGPQGASWLPEPVHQQVYTAVAPLLRGADGSYGIQLNLHPRDLGAVQVSVDVRHGEIAIQMHAVDPAAREALRDGLSDLRQQLEDQGLRTGSMEVGSGGADARQPEMSQSRSRGIALPNHPSDPSDPLVATAVAASTTALDLRM